MWYTYTMEYYSAKKKNKIILFAATWINIKTAILSEVGQRQTSYDIIYMWNIKQKSTNELI